MAISVLPYPTSPQITLSITLVLCISCFTSVIAFFWSAVSSNSKPSSNSCCHILSFINEIPIFWLLFACISNNCFAICSIFCFNFFCFNLKPLLPSLYNSGAVSFEHIYFSILSNACIGIYSLSSSAYFTQRHSLPFKRKSPS